MDKYYSMSQFSKILGVSSQTIRSWEAKGILYPHHKVGNGFRYYSQEQLDKLLSERSHSRLVVGYCRVSNNKQKVDLERQVEEMKRQLDTQNKPFEIITDIGSSMNYEKRGLKELIKIITQNKVEKVIVFHKDALLRFGFELVEYIASLYHCEIEVLDSSEKSDQRELVEDLAQIMTTFSCKL